MAVLVGADTESRVDGSLLSLSFSSSRGSAFTMPAGVCIPMEELEASWHNALFDLPMLLRAGYSLPPINHCTFLALKLLQADSFGLKANARRELGMVMRDYSDVVSPYQQQLSLDYLRRALEVARGLPAPEPRLIRESLPDGSGITIKPYKPTPLSRLGKPKRKGEEAPDTGKISRLLRDIEEGKLDKEGNPPDALKRWKEWREAGDGQTEAVEAVLGPHPVASLEDVPDPERMTYECQDADGGLRLFHVLRPRLESAGLWDAYQLDMASFPMVAEMESNGVLVDRPRLLRLITHLEQRLAEVEADCWALAGYPFNPQSSDQVAHLLYRKMGLRPRRYTDGGSEGTQDDDILPYRLEHPIVSKIIEYRRLLKLLSTYARPYEILSRLDGRVRCQYGLSQTIRFQGREPNLSAIPAHMGVVPVPEAAELHNCFIPEPGKVFLAWDASQIEMRVTAHHSQDAEMLRCFWEDEDIHTQTAMEVFGLPEAEVLADEDRYRYPMKRTGFGIVYGLTGSGLHRQMEYEMPGMWTEADCFQFIEDYLDKRPGVRQYMADTIATGRRTGEVRDLVGHRLLCPALRSPNQEMRQDEERRVINFRIQAGAVSIVKAGMAKVYQELQPISQDGSLKWLLQEHDAIKCEVEEDLADVVKPWVKELLEGAMELRVPIKASSKAGYTLGELN